MIKIGFLHYKGLVGFQKSFVKEDKFFGVKEVEIRDMDDFFFNELSEFGVFLLIQDQVQKGEKVVLLLRKTGFYYGQLVHLVDQLVGELFVPGVELLYNFVKETVELLAEGLVSGWRLFVMPKESDQFVDKILVVDQIANDCGLRQFLIQKLNSWEGV